MSVWIWKPHWSREKVDLQRCRASVHDGSGVGSRQCARKPVVFVDGIGYCKQHSPEEQERRAKEREEAYERQRKLQEKSFRRRDARNRVYELAVELRESGWILSDELKEKFDNVIQEATE